MIRVRQRKTCEGGSDIPVSDLLREARQTFQSRMPLLPEGELSDDEARRLLRGER
jgi:hypothetical protein